MIQKLKIGNFALCSPAFEHGEPIPRRYAGDGENVAPPLEWAGVPVGAKAFAVVVHDPDAPLVDGFVHWVAYRIPETAVALPEGGGATIAGVNSFGYTRYDGPGPPPGHGIHHYYFWIYALDEDLPLAPGLDRLSLLSQIEDHVIEQARLIGRISMTCTKGAAP
jgi:Raf kinase inhibitor-like YbhB/YbcL family protein